MKYQHKQPADVEAIQYLGTEESATAVIEWAQQQPRGPRVVRHQHRGSWNDEHPELWLKVMSFNTVDYTIYADPGCWIVVDQANASIDVLHDVAFREEYQLVEGEKVTQ